MSQLIFVDDMLSRLKDPESSYWGGSAAFLFAALHAAELGRTLKTQVQDLDVELKDLIASGLHGFEMDAVVYTKENPTAEELETWSDQYSYFAARIIGLGQDAQDRNFTYAAICLTEALDTMEAKQAEVTGKPVTDGSIHEAFMDVTEKEREEAEEVYNTSPEIIRDLEARVALCLFHKLLTRRARLKSVPPIDIRYALDRLDTLINSRSLFNGSDLLELGRLAGTCFRATKSSVKSDYSFVDRVLTSLSRVLAQ